MMKGEDPSVMDYFGELEDPRIERSKRHQLLGIMAIAICAVICRADSWVYMEMFGRSKQEWFRTFLDLPNRIPSHDTFGDVFSRLDPEQFHRSSSRVVSSSGPRRWRSFCPVRWWPSTAKQFGGPVTKERASRPFTL